MYKIPYKVLLGKNIKLGRGEGNNKTLKDEEKIIFLHDIKWVRGERGLKIWVRKSRLKKNEVQNNIKL